VFASVAAVKGQNPPTSLHVAAGNNDVAQIKQYIEKKANLNAVDSFGYTPLKRAVQSGHVEATQTLLEGGANPNIKDADGATVLILACQGGQKGIVDALLAAKADPNAKNRSGWTSLHLAVMTGSVEVAEALLNAGADVNTTNPGGQTALSLAKQRGNLPEMEDLLTKHGGTVPAVDPRLGPYGDYGVTAQQAAPAQTQVPTDFVVDPNVILKELAKFTVLDAPLKAVDANSESEQRTWVTRRSDNRTLLIRAVQKQFDDEMALIKHLAVEEKATKTAKAVDDLVAARKERYEQIGQELREQRRQTALESRETAGTARGRSATRGGRNRSTTTAGGSGQGPYGTPGQQGRASRRAQEVEPEQPVLSADTQAQLQAWLNCTPENKADLLKTAHDLDLAEYAAVHEFAVEEKAAKTDVAIMALLMQRQQRIAKIEAKWQEEDERMQRMQERQNADPSMQGTQQGMQGGRRGRR